MNATKPNEIVNVSIDADRVYDVVLIGAGISSANAAYILRQRDENLSMLVLEAKDRVGGRTLTIDIPSSRPGQTAKWDIGAQWVTDSQKNVTKLMRELNIETFKQFTTGNKVLESNGKRTVFNSAYPYDSWYSWLDMRLYMKRVDKDVKRLNTIHPYADVELAERLESQTFKDYLFSKAYTSTVRGVIRSNMSTVFGFELDQGGTQQITKKCFEYVTKHSHSSDDFNIFLNTLVTEIRQKEIGLDEQEQPLVEIVTQNTITGEKRLIKARKVISSLPINQYEKVKFVPELPFIKRSVFKFYQPGNYIKYIVTYKRAFWRDKGFSGQGTFDGSVKWLDEKTFLSVYQKRMSAGLHIKMPKMGAAAECWDCTDENGEPALAGFVAAQCAVEWADQDDELREREVIEDLCRLLGDEARDYVKYVDKKWSDEPYNNGCPCLSIIASGRMKDFARATREPFLNVHLCGTDTATEWQGYMDGAIESGERVANEILYKLYGNESSNRKIRIDYEKTFYHHQEIMNSIDAKNNLSACDKTLDVKPYEKIKAWSKLLLKCLPFVAGAGSLILIQFKYDLPKIGLTQLTKKFSL